MAKGREKIEALLDRSLGEPPERKAFHVIGNPTIHVDGDRATSSVIWTYVSHDDDGYPFALQLGHYEDVLAREDGRWRFERRTISRDLGYSPRDPDRPSR
jgi:hypothetical protein